MKIELSHVSKYYRDGEKSTRGLEDVSLSFETDSSFVVITGESGAGKSTLFRVLTGTEDFDEGEIYFDNQPLSGVSDEEKAKLYRENIAFDFQEYNLIEGFSPIENIVLSLTKAGYGLEEAKKRANSVLEEVGLHKQKKMKVAKLSGGERQRVAIARCLASDAKVLLFDEPTGNLDPETSKEIIALIESLQKGRLILYITHDFDLVRNKATRHIVLSDGKVLSDETFALPEKGEDGVRAEKHPTPMKSRLYTASLFAVKRPGRLFFTFLILLFSTAYLYFGSIGITYYEKFRDELTTSGTVTISGHGVGNEVLALKQSKDAKEIEESDDVYYDNLDLIKDFSWDIDAGSTLEEATSPETMRHIDTGFVMTPFLLDKNYIVDTLYTAKEKVDGALPYTVYLPRGTTDPKNTAIYSHLTELEDTHYYLVPSLLMSSMNNYYFYASSDSSQSAIKDAYAKEIKSVTKEIYIDKIYSYSFGDIESSTSSTASSNMVRYGCFSDATERKKCWKTSQDFVSFIKDPLPGDKKSKNYPSFYTEGLRRVLDPTYALYDNGNALRYSASVEENETKFNLSSYYKDKLSTLSFTYNGAKLTLDSFPADSFAFFNDADETKRYNYFVTVDVLFDLMKEKKAYGRYYASSIQKAKEITEDLNKSQVTAIYYDHKKTTIVNSKSNGAFFDVASRISDFFLLLAGVVGFLLVLFLSRALLSRFYYRKDSDEKVLSDIGYTPKDLYLLNAMQFVLIMSLCVFLCHLLFTLYIPNFAAMYVSNIPLMILSILLSLAVSFYVSKPSKAHKRRVRHHD